MKGGAAVLALLALLNGGVASTRFVEHGKY
jgi:hypothetical protein